MNKYILAGKLAEAGATETFIAEFFHHVAKDELRGDIFPEVLIADLCDVSSNAERNIKATRVVLESINGATEPLSLDTTIALFNAANDPNVSEVSRDSACFVLERGWWHAGLALVAEVRRLREREAKLRELHKPHGIYDECGHQHTEEDEILGIVDAGDAGLSCKKMYDVCTVCCDVADDGCQGETCVCDHDHSTDLPICKTREILDA